MLSYNDESWLDVDALLALCAEREHVRVVAFDSKRYVGAQIGIHAPDGRRVGAVSHLRNLEYLVIAGERDMVERAVAVASEFGPGAADGLGKGVDPPFLPSSGAEVRS